MPSGSKAVDLKGLANTFPRLPFVEPKPAEVRAAALLSKSGGRWTPELRLQARAFFSCEAGGVQLVLHMPELFAREELLKDVKYQASPIGLPPTVRL